MSRSVRRIVSAAVVLPVLLFAVAASSFALWRCRMDGIARTSCCCPQDKAAKAPAVATVSGVLACCEIEQRVLDKAPSEIGRTSVASLIAAVVALPVAIARAGLPAPPVEAWAFPREDDSGSGRAVVLAKRALLI